MSKNSVSGLPKLDALIVLSAVLPDWECKGARLLFNMQAQDKSIFKKNSRFFISPSKRVKYTPKTFESFLKNFIATFEQVLKSKIS